MRNSRITEKGKIMISDNTTPTRPSIAFYCCLYCASATVPALTPAGEAVQECTSCAAQYDAEVARQILTPLTPSEAEVLARSIGLIQPEDGPQVAEAKAAAERGDLGMALAIGVELALTRERRLDSLLATRGLPRLLVYGEVSVN